MNKSAESDIHFDLTFTHDEFCVLLKMFFYALHEAFRCNLIVKENFQQAAAALFGSSADNAPAKIPPLVRLDVTVNRDRVDDLLMMAGYGTGAFERGEGLRMRYACLHVINLLFSVLPEFAPYEIPGEYRWHELQ